MSNPNIPAQVFEEMEKTVRHRNAVAKAKGKHARCDCGAVDYERRTGRTTKQMQGAAKGAVFIVQHHTEARHTGRMARDLGRGDLRVYPATVLEDRNLVGQDLTGIVIDHHVKLTHRQYEELVALHHYVRETA